MKVKSIILCLLLFMSLSVARCFAQNPVPAVTRFTVIDPYLWDFKTVQEGAKPKHTFILKNDSPKVLNIKNVSTSCGCTASQVKKKVLQPGESTNIQVSFNSKGYSGAVTQFVYVNTDSLENPVIRYTIKADVVK